MKTFLLLFFAFVAASCASIDEILTTQAAESATDYPVGAMDGDISLVPEEEPKLDAGDGIFLKRQNAIVDDDDDEEGVEVEETAVSIDTLQMESTTAHWTEQGCIKENEHWEQCGPRCQMTCTFQPIVSDRRRSRATCESIFKGTCFPGCYCDTGYVRLNDECILPTDCPTRACLLNEEYKTHGTACQLTCDSYPYAEEIEARCPSDIPISGCFCKHGYVRGANAVCMLPNRCPRHRVS